MINGWLASIKFKTSMMQKKLDAKISLISKQKKEINENLIAISISSAGPISPASMKDKSFLCNPLPARDPQLQRCGTWLRNDRIRIQTLREKELISIRSDVIKVQKILLNISW